MVRESSFSAGHMLVAADEECVRATDARHCEAAPLHLVCGADRAPADRTPSPSETLLLPLRPPSDDTPVEKATPTARRHVKCPAQVHEHEKPPQVRRSGKPR